MSGRERDNGMSICTLAVKALRTEMSTANMRNNTKEAPTTDLSIMPISSVAQIAAWPLMHLSLRKDSGNKAAWPLWRDHQTNT